MIRSLEAHSDGKGNTLGYWWWDRTLLQLPQKDTLEVPLRIAQAHTLQPSI